MKGGVCGVERWVRAGLPPPLSPQQSTRARAEQQSTGARAEQSTRAKAEQSTRARAEQSSTTKADHHHHLVRGTCSSAEPPQPREKDYVKLMVEPRQKAEQGTM